MNKNKITGTTKLVRPKFAPGMLLQHEDLELLNEYTRNLSRLMFGSLFGCGVVCGLEVEWDPKCSSFVIGCGLAITPSGDPIWVPKGGEIKIETDCGGSELRKELWVILCRNVKHCSPRTSMSSSDDNENPSVYTREIEGYVIELKATNPEYACGCSESTRISQPGGCQCVDPESKCYKDHYDGKCTCGCNGCSDCDCVVLARLYKDDKTPWFVDYSARRFIRPVLMRDPQPLPKPGMSGGITERQTDANKNADALQTVYAGTEETSPTVGTV